MFPGMNMNSAQMKQAMKRMGVSQHDLAAQKVVITLADKELVFDHPQVSQVNMMGQESFQIAGEFHEESRDSMPEINESDIATVMQQTGKTRQEVLRVLEETKGDLAESILKLSEN